MPSPLPPTAHRPAPSPTSPGPDWRRYGRSTVLPILLLIGLMVVLAQLNLDLARPFTAPRLVSDEQGGFLFYGGGQREPGFFFRRVEETDSAVTFAKRRRAPGVLVSAALLPERLVTLYAGEREDAPWFYSISRRETLERTWSGFLDEPELGLVFPRHVARIHSQVFVFGSDAAGALRVARLDVDPLTEQARPDPLTATVPGGARVADLPTDSKERVPPPLSYASVVYQNQLYLFWRVSTEKGQANQPAGELRWAQFDGERFGPQRRLQADLQTFAPVIGLDGTLRLYGVKHGVRDSQILSFDLVGDDDFRPGAPIAYAREGLAGAGVTELAAGRTPKRVFLVARIGTGIQYTKDEGQGFQGWKDVARRPAEQTAVVYGWFLALIALSASLILQGLAAFRRRGGRPPRGPSPSLSQFVREGLRSGASEAPHTNESSQVAEGSAASDTSSEDNLASLPERALAFGVDLLLLFLILRGLGRFFPWLEVDAALEPAQQLTFAAWASAILVGYFCVFEIAFARTPGKRLFGLEVQDLDGARPSAAAILYRNAFRVELLIPPFYVVPVISLVLMLTSRYTQRPGDLVAHTTVRRSRRGYPSLSGEPVQD